MTRVVWVNGGFGVGKTTAAEALRMRPEIGSATLFDPEWIGMGLRRSLGPEVTMGDFQDPPMWLAGVVGTLDWVDATTPVDTLVVPMSVFDPERWEAIRPRVDLAVWLHADPEVLTDRILGRPTGEGDHDWCLSHRAAAAEAEAVLVHDLVVVTDDLTPDQVVDRIAARLVEG